MLVLDIYSSASGYVSFLIKENAHRCPLMWEARKL